MGIQNQQTNFSFQASSGGEVVSICFFKVFNVVEWIASGWFKGSRTFDSARMGS